jgi:hypothetical protein
MGALPGEEETPVRLGDEPCRSEASNGLFDLAQVQDRMVDEVTGLDNAG